MQQTAKITALAEQHKSVIWGLFLATTIFKFAIGNFFLAGLCLLFLMQVFENKKVLFQKNFLPLAVYFFWGVFSLCWTTDYSDTIKGIGITLPLILLPVFISQYSRFSSDDLAKTIKVFSVCLLAYLLVCTLKAGWLFLGDGKLGHFFYHSLVSIFDNNAIYISLAVSVCILFVFNMPQKKTEDYLILLLLGFFLLALASKNLIVTTFLLTAVSLFKNQNLIKKGVVISFALMLVFVPVLFFDNPVKARFLKEINLDLHHVLTAVDFYNYKFNGIEIRVFQWRMLAEMVTSQQIGLLGLGLHNVDYLLEQYFNYYNLFKGYFHINFHNQYLQSFGELGIIGLLLLMSLFFWAIRSAINGGNRYRILFTLLFVCSFFTESYLSRQKGVFLFAAFYCLLLMDNPSKEDKNRLR